MRLVQMFRGSSHSLKLRFYGSMMQAISDKVSVTSVGVVFMIPDDQEFERVKEMSGLNKLQSWGWDKVIQIVQFSRSS